MKRTTKRKLSTVIGCVLGGVTLTGPMAGEWLANYQCRRGLCPHSWHRHRYAPPSPVCDPGPRTAEGAP